MAYLDSDGTNLAKSRGTNLALAGAKSVKNCRLKRSIRFGMKNRRK
jgi:hypothetical protein